MFLILLVQEASVFFKKRAALEEEYGKSLQKLSKATSDVYSMNDGKAGYDDISYILPCDAEWCTDHLLPLGSHL